MMRVLSACLLVLVLYAQTGESIVCYQCIFQYSAMDNFTRGVPECGDASWGLDPSSDASIAVDCRSCYKEFYNLGADRFEVVRGCSWGLPPPVNGVTAWDRQQKTNTCATTMLKAGEFSRCACDTDLCNERTSCDTAQKCFEDSCPPLDCGTSTCPPGSSGHTHLPATVLLFLSAIAVGGYNL